MSLHQKINTPFFSISIFLFLRFFVCLFFFLGVEGTILSQMCLSFFWQKSSYIERTPLFSTLCQIGPGQCMNVFELNVFGLSNTADR